MEFEIVKNIAVIRFDDQKANAIGPIFIDQLNSALDQALVNAEAVVLSGRTGMFSGGFDLNVFKKGPLASQQLMLSGAQLLLRLFTLPLPLVVSCTGHAIAAGAFILLTADTRIGTTGNFKVGLNEPAINATFPTFGSQLALARLNPSYLTRSFVQAELFDPIEAIAAGFLDRAVGSETVLEESIEVAEQFARLPTDAYVKNKLDIRSPYIHAIQESLGVDESS